MYIVINILRLAAALFILLDFFGFNRGMVICKLLLACLNFLYGVILHNEKQDKSAAISVFTGLCVLVSALSDFFS